MLAYLILAAALVILFPLAILAVGTLSGLAGLGLRARQWLGQALGSRPPASR